GALSPFAQRSAASDPEPARLAARLSARPSSHRDRIGRDGVGPGSRHGGPGMTASVGPPRPALEVADVIREHGEAFLAKHGGSLTVAQRKALRDLSVC